MPLDRRRFDVILANLIGNALCHGSPPVTVQASIQAGPMAASSSPCWSATTALASPLTPCRTCSNGSTRPIPHASRSEDSGLGLAIAWENTRLHGGRIEAANHPGGGALFTLWLPVRRTEPAMLPDDEPVTVTRS